MIQALRCLPPWSFCTCGLEHLLRLVGWCGCEGISIGDTLGLGCITFSKGFVPIGTCPAFGDGLIDTVNARELHKALGSKREYATWVKQRIDACNFKENEDFVVFDGTVKNPLGGRPTKEYFLTLDAAKHFAMLEKTETVTLCWEFPMLGVRAAHTPCRTGGNLVLGHLPRLHLLLAHDVHAVLAEGGEYFTGHPVLEAFGGGLVRAHDELVEARLGDDGDLLGGHQGCSSDEVPSRPGEQGECGKITFSFHQGDDPATHRMSGGHA